MATATGKVMRRKIGGNRYTLKARGRYSRKGKVFNNEIMTKQQYREAKNAQRKRNR